MSRNRTAAFAVMACVAFAACAVNPATGKRQIVLISEAQERQIGAENDKQIVASLGLYPDESMQAWIQQLGTSLAAKSERPNLDWTFRVVDDPVVNAFALPGGYIYITRGILAHLDNEAELAGVVGHEIGHVTARHGVSQMTKQTLAQLGLGVGMILSEDLAQLGGLATAGLELLFLKYSRDDETQADGLGLEYLNRAGYDPRPMAQVYTVLERVGQASGGGEDLPTYMLTHPKPADRRERIQAQIAELPQDFADKPTKRTEYMQRLDQIVFGEDPRQGFFEGQDFLHPDMAFRLTFPAGWKTLNTKQAVLAGSPEQDAIIQLTLADATSSRAALDAFVRQSGVTPGQSWRNQINGLQAASIGFTAQAEQGQLSGIAAFVEHRQRVFSLLGYTTPARWAANRQKLEAALASFGELTDRAALDVRPARLDIVRANANETLEAFARRNNSTADLETLALINQVEAGARLEGGQLYKVVVGGRPMTASASR